MTSYIISLNLSFLIWSNNPLIEFRGSSFCYFFLIFLRLLYKMPLPGWWNNKIGSSFVVVTRSLRTKCQQAWFPLRDVREALGLIPSFWWFAGNLGCSSACRSITVISAYIVHGLLPGCMFVQISLFDKASVVMD